MAENDRAEESGPKGNEWEVVSLTASAYAAAPGPRQIDLGDDSQENLSREKEAETSHAMFMSGHFVFPPSQHENLPLDPEYNEICNEKDGESYVCQLVAEGGRSAAKDEEDASVKGLMCEEFPGTFDEKGNMLSVSGSDYKKEVVIDKEQSMYSNTKLMHGECLSRSITVEAGEEVDDGVEPFHDTLDSGLSDSQKEVEEHKFNGSKLPCEAWWKRRAFSLYVHAKEANACWSIFVAAAVMGIVILGHRWQQQRSHVLYLKWQSGVNNEKLNRVFGPVARFRDMFVGGQRRSSLMQGSA